jgi:peptide/nickel transport system substrate-binding protein
MKRDLRVLAATGAVLLAFSAANAALAQKSGGTLKVGHFDSPASMSMLEESTAAVNRPMMGVFNNLVMFKQDEPQNTPESIMPELATRVALERGRHRIDVPAAPGGQMA